MKTATIAGLAKKVSRSGAAAGRRTYLPAVAVLIALTLSAIARASWLDEVWSEESVLANGSPSITVRRDAVDVVLPAVALRKAHDEGATLTDSINAFLDRYGPHCSDLLSFNLPHPGLKVRLSLQVQVPSVSESSGRLPFAEEPNRDQTRLFAVFPEHFDLSIDYVPTQMIHCVVPNDEAPTS